MEKTPKLETALCAIAQLCHSSQRMGRHQAACDGAFACVGEGLEDHAGEKLHHAHITPKTNKA